VSAVEERAAPQLGITRASSAKPLKGKRSVYVPEAGGFVSCPVYDRYALSAATTFSGPAVVEEPESTVYVGSGANALVTRTGDLRVMLPSKATTSSTRRRPLRSVAA
jgi:N-methylhydantoinase A/oxoprolinase/acetone carboxylase beta subunit